MNQRNPVLGQSIRDRVEIGSVMRGADMFEHADRHDPVIARGLVPVVAKVKRHLAVQTRQHGMIPGIGELLL